MGNFAKHAVLVGLSVTIFSMAISPAHADDACHTDKVISLSEVETLPSTCLLSDRRVSVANGLSISIPKPGESRFMSVLFDNGTSLDAIAHRDSNGSLSVEVDGKVYGQPLNSPSNSALAATIAPLAANSSTCSYTSFVRFNGNPKWTSTHLWRYNPTSEVNTSSLTAIRTGLNTWRSGTNQCTSTSYATSFPSGYLGTSSAVPAGNASGCGATDGQNVIGWRPLATGVLGLTCGAAAGSSFTEADVTFTTSASWFSNTGTSGCSGQFDLVSIATHEIGHVLGLDHEPAGTGQVMIPSFTTCQLAYRNLGAGDLAGVTSIYP